MLVSHFRNEMRSLDLEPFWGRLVAVFVGFVPFFSVGKLRLGFLQQNN